MFISIISVGTLLTASNLRAQATAADGATGKGTSDHTKRAKTKSGHDADDVAADNTAVNKRDRDEAATTADQQKNDKSDTEIVAAIRRSIVKDKTLSTNAHNIKIVVIDGKVTLKGPVASKDERATVEKRAVEVVGKGKGRITNDISVAP